MSWWIALLLKPLFVAAFAFAYYVIVYRGSHVIGWFITSPRLYDFLFRERGRWDRRFGLPAVHPRNRSRSGARPSDTQERLLK